MVQPPADPETDPDPGSGPSPPARGWPLPVKIVLAVLVLGFVWSPFLAMLYRLSQPNPSLAPTAIPGTGTPELPAPAVNPAEPNGAASSPSSAVPSP